MDNKCALCDQADGMRRSHHSDKLKTDLTARLNKIEGQVRGIKGLVEKDTYCDDVLNQLSAVQSALNSVGKVLLEAHVKSCVTERVKAGDTEVIEELMATIKRLIR